MTDRKHVGMVKIFEILNKNNKLFCIQFEVWNTLFRNELYSYLNFHCYICSKMVNRLVITYQHLALTFFKSRSPNEN